MQPRHAAHEHQLGAAPARHVPRKWTPPDAFKPDIVAVLEEAGGELDQEDLFRVLEERMGERLTEADHQSTPEGELRWRYAARRAVLRIVGTPRAPSRNGRPDDIEATAVDVDADRLDPPR